MVSVPLGPLMNGFRVTDLRLVLVSPIVAALSLADTSKLTIVVA
jgi:hypothetical protein